MPKLKPSPVLTCDICEFRATNGYIFKRHLHRCFSLHGIASKRSTSRNPIRLKGTEGLLTKDSSYETTQDFLYDDSVEPGDEHALTEDGRAEFPETSEGPQVDSGSSLPWEPSSSCQLMLKPPDLSPQDDDAGRGLGEDTPGNISQVMPGAPYCRYVFYLAILICHLGLFQNR